MSRMSSVKSAIYLGTCAVLLASVNCAALAVAQKPKPTPKPVTHRNAPAKPVTPKPMVPKRVESPGQFVISASAETGQQLFGGWPLIISANLWRRTAVPDDKGVTPTVEPITIKAKSGAWMDALVVEVKSANGQSVKWPLHAVKQTEPSVTLGVDDEAAAEWWVEPTDTQSINPGNYTISISFDPKLVDGLPADAQNDSFSLRVAKEPSPMDQDTQSDKLVQMAMLALVKDDSKTADDLVGTLLQADPQSIGGHRLKADILLREGKKREAVSSLDDALDAYREKYPYACPPAGILDQRAEILKDIEPPTLSAEESEKPE